MSEEDVNAQEGAEKNGEDKGTPGDEGNYASKEELEALARSVEGMASKSDQLYKIITSDAFMNRGTPAPAPAPVVPREKEIPASEIDEFTPSQTIGYALKKMTSILEAQGRKQSDTINRMGATIQNMVQTQADKDADRQIEACRKEFGKEEFNKHLNKMAKIVKDAPGTSARRAYLIAIGEEKPPVKKEVSKATLTEKPGQFGDFKDQNLDPKEAANKAFDMVVGGKDKLI